MTRISDEELVKSREERMIVVECDETGKPTIWCDPEIVDLVTALTAGGIRTIASCSGHGHRPGSIALADGRWLVIAKDDAEHDKIEAIFRIDINGDRLATLAKPGVADAYKTAALKVIDAVRDYLPPNGIDSETFANRVIESVDNPEFNAALAAPTVTDDSRRLLRSALDRLNDIFDPEDDALYELRAALEAALSLPAQEGEMECATEGCGRTATVRFERGGVGSHYCYACYLKVQSLSELVEKAKRGEIGDNPPSSGRDPQTLDEFIATPHPASADKLEVVVPKGQTPLSKDLKHPFLDVIDQGSTARDAGTGSPYHGHSLEHCLHATGWVQRDLRLALDDAKAENAAASRLIAEKEARINELSGRLFAEGEAATFYRAASIDNRKRAEAAEAQIASLKAENERMREELVQREARRLEILEWVQEQIGTGWNCTKCGYSTYHANANECADCGEEFPFENMVAFKLHATGTDNSDFIEQARSALSQNGEDK